MIRFTATSKALHRAIVGLLLLLPLAPRMARGAAPAMSPCEVPGVERPATCGVVVVPESWDSPGERELSLRVLVLPASAKRAASDALFFLAGGPGDAATRSAGFVAEAFAAVLATRDIVLVDQRGTGESNPLRCTNVPADEDLAALFAEALIPVAAIQDCRRELEQRADLTQYTTSSTIRDLEAVREALGYDEIDLYGTSYGSRLALVYLRERPEHLRTVVLKGVAPPGMLYPLHYARDAQASLSALFADCGASPACRGAYPDPAGDLDEVLDRLAIAPARVELVDPASGRSQSVRLTREAAATTLLGLLQSPTTAARIPLLVQAAHRGDHAPLAQMVLRYRLNVAAVLYLGLHLSVACPEDVRFYDRSTAQLLAEGTFLGTDRSLGAIAACEAWPGRREGWDIHAPVHSGVPVLLISGEHDPVTPPRWAEQAANHLARARHLVVRGASHSFEGMMGCVDGLIASFIESASAEGLDARCVESSRRLPFVLPE